MIHRLTLANFRNHRDTRLEDCARFNLLTGPNGAGKTNVLEAISLFAPGRGLRRAALGDMAAQGGAGGFAIGVGLAAQGGAPVALGTGTLAEAPNRRLVRVNGVEAPATRLGEWLALAWLTPAMDRLFADTPGARRRFLDRLVLALFSGHAAQVSRYERALAERNRLLAMPDEADAAWFDGIEAQMGAAGGAVRAARAAVVAQLNAALTRAPPSPFARAALAIDAAPFDAPDLTTALAASRPRDRAARRSLIGPHRDDLAVTLAEKRQPAALCSTGEQKALLIGIVLAHGDLVDAQTPDRPRLLLLDEVAAHLDPERRAALFGRLATGRAQVWMTGTEAAPFAAVAADCAHWQVREGTAARA